MNFGILKAKLSYFLEGNAITPANLGLFRVSLGLALLFQLVVYIFPVLPISYYQDGLINQTTYHHLLPVFSASVFDLLPTHWAVQLYFALTVCCLLLFIIGYRTKVISLFLLLLFWNIYQRGGLVSGTESRYGLCLLFLACFLPLNSAFTFKRFKQDYTLTKTTFLLACTAILVQVGWVYLSTGLQKWDTEWLDGTALQIAFNDPLNTYAFWLGKDFSWTSLLCLPIMVLEIAIGLGWLLLPKRQVKIRWLLVIGLWSLHVGIVVFLNLWQFFVFAMAASTLLLPINTHTGLQFKFLPTKGVRKFGFFLIAYILLMSLANLQLLSINGMLKEPIKMLKLKKPINIMRLYGWDIASPLNQYWRLYGIIPDKLGCVTITGSDKYGNAYNLITQQYAKNICCDYNNMGEKDYLEILRIPYLYADFKNVQEYYSLHTRRLLQAWNEQNRNQLDTVSMDFCYLNGSEKVVENVLKCNSDTCIVFTAK